MTWRGIAPIVHYIEAIYQTGIKVLAQELQPYQPFWYPSKTLPKWDITDDNGSAIAFMNLSLRSEYVPGATQNPVAYIEGIYVLDEYRNQGVGTALIKFAEQWAIEHRCVELASDALIENTVSYEFHTKVGFREVERVVFFIKPVVAPD